MDWLRMILSLIGVVGLIILLFYALRKLNKVTRVANGGKMRILDRVNLGRDGMLLVVSVGGKLMLIGATQSRIEKLCDLDMTEEEYEPAYRQTGTDGKGQAVSFQDVIKNLTGKNRGESSQNAEDGENRETGREEDD